MVSLDQVSCRRGGLRLIMMASLYTQWPDAGKQNKTAANGRRSVEIGEILKCSKPIVGYIQKL